MGPFPWSLVPPGWGTTDVSLSAATQDIGNPLTAPLATMSLFGKGIDDGRVYTNWTKDGLSWSGWFEVPAANTRHSGDYPPRAGIYYVIPFTTAAALCAVSFPDPSGLQYVFAQSASRLIGTPPGTIYVNSTDGNDWSGWLEIPGGFTTDQAVSAVVAAGSLFIFAKHSETNTIHVNRTTDGTTWKGWTEVPGGGTTNAALSAGLGGNPTSTTLYLFGKGIDVGHIYVNSTPINGPLGPGTLDGTNWSGWDLVPAPGSDSLISWVAPFALSKLLTFILAFRTPLWTLTTYMLRVYTVLGPESSTPGAIYVCGYGPDGTVLPLGSAYKWGAWQPIHGGGVTDVALAGTSLPNPNNLFEPNTYLFSKGIEDRRIYYQKLPI